ncbi:MAG: sigma-54 interaction domain-containing protein [Pirellulaceae bacterium]
MGRILCAWLGNTDLRASEAVAEAGLGPIAQAVKGMDFGEVVLLCDYAKKAGASYAKWLKRFTSAPIKVRLCKLSGPTEFDEIYEAVVATVHEEIKTHDTQPELAFHLSPGTPAMAAVWVIVAKTRFPAQLIESSPQKGARVVSFPFQFSADFIPDLLRKPDEELVRLTQGLPPESPEFDEIIHRCRAMKELIARARRVAPRNAPILIQGESGTGKELLARAIHQASPRREKPFVALNCGAIPNEIVESELFGHVKGAFTGATKSRAGHIESASGGTLFLDEIGELLLHTQVKLLRVLQEGEVLPVGADRPRPVEIRVISATNSNLIDQMTAGRFREDLFHRIAVAVLFVPPIREREGDLGLLVDRLLEKVNDEAEGQPGHQHKNLSAGARNLLLQHRWPGNVRELLNTLQRAVLWSTGGVIRDRDIRDALLPSPSPGADGVLDRPLGKGLKLPELLSEVARHYLTRAHEKAAGNKTLAAELVGLSSYQTFTNWMNKYGVD